jgi:hypothetical protein
LCRRQFRRLLLFALEAQHEGRFKTFISHDGVFDFRSMYGTTDEMFFENWEKGGSYWDKNNAVAQRSFSQSPSNFIEKWNTPILIIQGGKDYRVPMEQGQQAFQAAQLKGIKSRFIYIPDENHWVLSQQNALVWQREFYKWLDETSSPQGHRAHRRFTEVLVKIFMRCFLTYAPMCFKKIISIIPRPKQQTPNPHHRTPLFNRHLVIAAHPHAQNRPWSMVHGPWTKALIKRMQLV